MTLILSVLIFTLMSVLLMRQKTKFILLIEEQIHWTQNKITQENHNAKLSINRQMRKDDIYSGMKENRLQKLKSHYNTENSSASPELERNPEKIPNIQSPLSHSSRYVPSQHGKRSHPSSSSNPKYRRNIKQRAELVFDHQQIVCPYGNQAYAYCTQQFCQSSTGTEKDGMSDERLSKSIKSPIVCVEKKCQCSSVHQGCMKLNKLESLQARLRSNLMQQRTNVIEEMQKMFGKMKQFIQGVKQTLLYRFDFFGWTEEEIQLNNMLLELQRGQKDQKKSSDIIKCFKNYNESKSRREFTDIFEIYSKPVEALNITLNKIQNRIKQLLENEVDQHEKFIKPDFETQLSSRQKKQLKQIVQRTMNGHSQRMYPIFDSDKDTWKGILGKVELQENLLVYAINEIGMKFGAFIGCQIPKMTSIKSQSDPQFKSFLFSMNENGKPTISKVLNPKNVLSVGNLLQMNKKAFFCLGSIVPNFYITLPEHQRDKVYGKINFDLKSHLNSFAEMNKTPKEINGFYGKKYIEIRRVIIYQIKMQGSKVKH